ncbi:PREDICTED: CRAL-TRIO domain-containing protein YKL091C [Camelina sativa]|uniref:CRAL-TRIO domain-containing protein YKL091C n=1 Tax=Camelina sativa TaxID=90675 RepID=A0ABM0Y740_CAMSA|nr:PREDICTED: CRAL-TRIO domain-containing protein YKL091C [Camelina sativa]
MRAKKIMEESQELAALTQLKKSVEKLSSSTEGYEDPTLMRFLVARSMDPDKAAKMFVDWRKWRASMVPPTGIPDLEVKDELEFKKICLQGPTKSGHPMVLVITSKHFPAKDQAKFKKFCVYCLDKTIASGIEGKEVGDEKLVAVIDLANITYKNLDARGLITAFQFLQSYYPERLEKCYILHMPGFFVTVWKFVCRFLEKATQEKIVIVTSGEEQRKFEEEIGVEALPEEYGGQAKLTLIQDVVLPQTTPVAITNNNV